MLTKKHLFVFFHNHISHQKISTMESSDNNNNNIDKEIGFSRDDLGKNREILHGKSSPPLFRHAFYLTKTPALEWDPDCAFEPLTTLGSLVEKNNIRITAAQALEGLDEEGDVLIFPDFCRVRLGPASSLSKEAINDFALRLQSKVPFLVGEDCTALSLAQVFLCAHQKRDARCGYCGPELYKAIENEEEEVQARLCSHIGGHVYAGNALVFRVPNELGMQSMGDWFGYVTPRDVPELLKWTVQSKGDSSYPPHGVFVFVLFCLYFNNSQ